MKGKVGLNKISVGTDDCSLKLLRIRCGWLQFMLKVTYNEKTSFSKSYNDREKKL